MTDITRINRRSLCPAGVPLFPVIFGPRQPPFCHLPAPFFSIVIFGLDLGTPPYYYLRTFISFVIFGLDPEIHREEKSL